MDSIHSMRQSPFDTPCPTATIPVHEEFHCQTVSSSDNSLSASDILLWLLQLPLHSRYRKQLQATGILIGRVSWRSAEKIVDRQNGTKFNIHSSMISIHLPIIQRAFALQGQRSMGSWSHTFRMTNIVPDNSEIFRLCATAENDFEIRSRFDMGLASPFDQTTSGVTLLHAAAAGYRCRTYQFLHDLGVEYSLCEHPKYGKL